MLSTKLKSIFEIVSLLASVTVMFLLRKKLWASRARWVEADTFLLLYLIVNFLVSLPLDLYDQHRQLKDGFSVQSWASYFGDAGKSFVLGMA